MIEDGCGFLAKRLSDNIKKLGGIINLNKEITSFTFSDGSHQKIDQILFKENVTLNTEKSIVISTLPITTNADLFNLKTDLYFRSILLINIIIKGKDPFPQIMIGCILIVKMFLFIEWVYKLDSVKKIYLQSMK